MTAAPLQRDVGPMFDSIAHRYDFLNHFLSLGLDFYWRRIAIRQMVISETSTLLDCATGTCDLALEAARYSPRKIIGIDISMNMLHLGMKKVSDRSRYGAIELVANSAEYLAFRDGRFDAAMIAFGVRNFANLDQGLREIKRVLKPGGRFVILEFSKPRIFPFKQLYFFYFRTILPVIGRAFSKDANAYTYLPASVMAFPEGEAFRSKLIQAGFQNASYIRLTLGIVTVYKAVK